jgi:arginine/glutamate-rich protein 1
VKRIEEMVALRVAEELEKRKDEIEAEVLRRVEEAKQIMEKQMLEELERRRKERLEEENRREVLYFVRPCYPYLFHRRWQTDFAMDKLLTSFFRH